jgi:uncharacterized protein (DUF305 family)
MGRRERAAWWAIMAAGWGVGVPVSSTSEADEYRVRQEQQYMAESEVAMKRMMRSMAGAPRGDVDRDFVEQMIPHHQGAIDMAEAFLRTGKSEQLKRMAQEIVVTQREEIAVMRHAVETPHDSR